MKIIAHRGNLNGPDEKRDNNISAILECINLGFDVEIDLWYYDDKFYLGHDQPMYVLKDLSLIYNDQIWVHAKNLDCLYKLDNKSNFFFHNIDDATITSRGYLWIYPGKKLGSNCVAVKPEVCKYTIDELRTCSAICTDYPIKYKDTI